MPQLPSPVSTPSRWLALLVALGTLASVSAAQAPATAAAVVANPLGDEVESTTSAATLMKKYLPDTDFSADLATLAKDAAAASDPATVGAVRERLRTLRRRILFAHPGLAFDQLLVNVQCPPQYSHNCDQYLGRHSKIVSSKDPSQSAAGVVVVSGWKSGTPQVRSLTREALPPGATRHPDLSYDAKTVLFAYCDHRDKNPEHRRFLVYEVPIAGGTPRQITGTGKDAMEREDGRYTVLLEDFDPTYLPDGGFVFTSTRGQNFGRCHGGRYTPSFFLHRGELDGSGIRPLSFGEANEITPTVLNDGRIAYNRWDYINRHDCRFHKLWSIHPDGTGTANYWGNLTPDPLSMAEPRAIPGSTKIIATATAHHSFTAGSIMLIDTSKGDEGETPLTHLTPEVAYPESHGYPKTSYATPYPITEDLFLAAYSDRPHVHQGQVQQDDAYGICLVWNVGGKAYREPVFSVPLFSCFSPIPVAPRQRPPVLPSRLDPTAATAAAPSGTCYVQNVYQSTQPIPKDAVKFLRVNEILNQPAAQHAQRSRVDNENTKRVLGTVPVAADGSVAFRAPAGKRLQFQLLDQDHMAIMTMRTFVYLQPGEVMGCTGCHESRQDSPHASYGRTSPARRVLDLTPPPGPAMADGFSYVAQVQPVLDRNCISCHGLGAAPKTGISLLGTYTSDRRTFSESYISLVDRPGFMGLFKRNQESSFSVPRDGFAARSKLPALLANGHYGVKLDNSDWERVIAWLDLNCQFYGNYSFNRLEQRQTVPEAEKALRAAIASQFGAELAAQPYAALVNNVVPSESRILKAPLATTAGGWGQIAKGWSGTTDPGYVAMKRLVEATIAALPASDSEGTCHHDGKCVCGVCWVKAVEMAYRKGLPPSAAAALTK